MKKLTALFVGCGIFGMLNGMDVSNKKPEELKFHLAWQYYLPKGCIITKPDDFWIPINSSDTIKDLKIKIVARTKEIISANINLINQSAKEAGVESREFQEVNLSDADLKLCFMKPEFDNKANAGVVWQEHWAKGFPFILLKQSNQEFLKIEEYMTILKTKIKKIKNR